MRVIVTVEERWGQTRWWGCYADRRRGGGGVGGEDVGGGEGGSEREDGGGAQATRDGRKF